MLITVHGEHQSDSDMDELFEVDGVHLFSSSIMYAMCSNVFALMAYEAKLLHSAPM